MDEVKKVKTDKNQETGIEGQVKREKKIILKLDAVYIQLVFYLCTFEETQRITKQLVKSQSILMT